MAVAAVIAAVLVLFPYPSLASARSQDTRVVDLQVPLEAGRYIVIHGGGNAVVNQHALVPAQRYALDILAVDRWGFRASSAMPHDLSRYVIYGKRVLAPCKGVILAEQHDHADLPPLDSDRSAPAGNHVLLHCSAQDITVLVAHLQRDSVEVAAGSHVDEGEVLGRVGNSGNTSEPHLHIHGVVGRVSEIDVAIRTAEPVALRWAGQTLIRNDIFTSNLAVR